MSGPTTAVNARYARRNRRALAIEAQRERGNPLGAIEVIEVTDPPNQIPADRRYSTAFLGGGTVGVWDRWTDTLHETCPGGCPEAIARAAVLNGRAIPMTDGDLAALATALIGGEPS